MDLNSGASSGATFDSTNLNQYSTPDLIRFLLTSFRPSEYEEVARIIAAREQDANAVLSRLRIEKIGVDARCGNLEHECSSLLTRQAELAAMVKSAESSLAAKADEIDRIREQLERAEEELAITREEEKQAKGEAKEELAIAREEEKRAKGEAKEWLRKYCEVQANVLKGFDDNRELKEKIEVLEKEKETGAWCRRARGDADLNRCRARGDADLNRCNGVKLEGRLGNGGTAIGNEGAGIVGVIEISDEEDDMDVKSCGGYWLRWTPCGPAANAINHAIRSQFRGPYHCWSAIDQDVKDFWWREFCEKVSWNPRDEAYIKKLFQQKTTRRLSDMLSKVRKKGMRPSWMGEEAWRDLNIVWNGEDFKKISTRNKTNRASSRGGAVHTTGRTAHLEVALKMTRKLGHSVDPDELFKTTHTKKSGDWVDERSRSTYRQYRDRMTEIETHIGDSTEGGQEVDGETKLELWKEVAGGKKSGRCYGTADLSSNLRRGISSLTQESRAPSNISDGSEQATENALLRHEVTTTRQKAAEANQRYVNLEEQFRAMMDRMATLERQSVGASTSASQTH